MPRKFIITLISGLKWIFSSNAGNLGSFLAGISTLGGVIFAIIKLTPSKVRISVQKDFSYRANYNYKFILNFVIEIRDDTAWYSPEVFWKRDKTNRILVLKDKEGRKIEFPRHTDKGVYTFYAEAETYEPNTVIDRDFIDEKAGLFISNGTSVYKVKILPRKKL